MTPKFFGGASGLPAAYGMLYNGQTGDGVVKIGKATSADAGVTWTRYASNPVMIPGAGWYSGQVHAPSVVWDGSQWCMYYGGYDGTKYQLGRATSTDLVSWSQAANPLVTPGSAGQFDDAGMNFPTIRYDVGATPRWQLWYTGWKSGGNTTIGYADSTDGLSWTKRGQVLAEGTAGAFDDTGLATGPAYLLAGTYYVFYAGFRSARYHTGYATCTSPTGTYTKQGVISQFSGNVTSLDDALTYQSNQLRSIVLRGSGFVGYGTAFHPVSPPTQHEVSFRTTSTNLVTWTTPTGVLLPLSGGTFDTISAENPSVIAT